MFGDANAGNTEIGASRIIIPEPDGFVFFSSDKQVKNPIIAGLLLSCDNLICATFVDEESLQAFRVDDKLTMPRFFQIEVMIEDVSMGSQQFQELKAAMTAGLDGLMGMLENGTRTALAKLVAKSAGRAKSAGGEDLVFEEVEFELLDYKFETESQISFSFFVHYDFRTEDLETRRYTISVTLSAANVKGNVLTTTVYGRGPELAWTQAYSTVIIEDALRLNVGK